MQRFLAMGRRVRAHPVTGPALGLVISGVLIAGCVVWATEQDAPRFPKTLGHWAVLVAAVLMCGVNTLMRGWRWDRILASLRVDHRRSDSYGLTLVAYMGNVVLPARGGDLVRAGLLASRSRATVVEAVGTIVPERMLDASTLVLYVVVLSAAGVVDPPGGLLTVVAAVAVLTALFAALFVLDAVRRRGGLQKLSARIRPFARPTRMLLTSTGAVLGLGTLAIWLGEGVLLKLVCIALDVHLSLPETTATAVATSFAAIVPAAPGYLGTFDAAMIFVLDQYAVTGGVAFGLILLYRFVLFVPVTIAGLLAVILRYGGIGALRRRSSVVAAAELA